MATVKKTVSQAKAKGLKNAGAMAIHGTDGEMHVVGIGNLRVVICPDESGWFAQGLEIDYAAGGSSVEQVKNNFQKGLKGTIGLHIQMYGSIEKFLTPAPPEVWKDLYWSGKQYRFSQVSLHDDLSKSLNVKAIEFLEPVAEAMI